MTPAARVSAAIEVLAALEAQRRPAADALTDWGRSHRFAGSGDRAAIASLVYDALRRHASSAFIMDDASPRGVILGSLREAQGLSANAIAALCSGEGHAPALLSPAEAERLATATLAAAPAHVAGDVPEWLEPHLARAFGTRSLDETRALATRAPLDLRANLLKATRDKALAALAHLGAVATPLSPTGLRIALGADGRGPAMAGERAWIKGLVEVQDEGSQLAARLAAARPGEQVLDLCAGAGGKTLAMAADMDNRGQIYATDEDGRRLAAIFPRLERAAPRNVQVRMPKRGQDVLGDLGQRCDLVVVDAPCTGTGTWRRNPDAKWRIRPGALDQRIKDQNEVLARAAAYVAENGRLAYVTCSVLAEENEDRIADFLAAHPQFQPVPTAEICAAAGLAPLTAYGSTLGPGLRLSPATSGTDGFYVCVLRRTVR
jgi:16S rRNA (cytosine967-C5)-methyltransferase